MTEQSKVDVVQAVVLVALIAAVTVLCVLNPKEFLPMVAPTLVALFVATRDKLLKKPDGEK